MDRSALFIGSLACLLLFLNAGCGDDATESDGGGSDSGTPRDATTSPADQSVPADAPGREDVAAPACGDDLLPPTLVGYGAEVTGGRGGTVYPITSRGDDESEGTVRWALAQGDPDDPRVLLLMVEGVIDLDSRLRVRNSNLTIDGSFAPGEGAWFEGERIEILGSNVLLQHVSFLGNDDTPNGSSSDPWGTSEPMKVGLFPPEVGDLDGIYIRHCAFLHGRDETLAFTTRRNGDATGNVVSNVTVESTIIANPVGHPDGSHAFGVFVGDGVERITFVRNLLSTMAGRMPFIRGHADEVELINNVLYNGAQNQVNSTTERVHIIGNEFRRGPMGTIYRPIMYSSDEGPYLEDNIGTNGAGADLVQNTCSGCSDADPSPTPHFPGSGTVALSSSEVRGAVLAAVGPRLRDLGRSGYMQRLADEVESGDAPTSPPTFPGAVPDAGDAVRDPGSYIPEDYRGCFEDDADLAATISGGPWDGHQVWERVSAWQTR